MEILEEAIASHERPKYIRSNNEPELIAYHVQDWMKGEGIVAVYIQPSSP